MDIASTSRGLYVLTKPFLYRSITLGDQCEIEETTWADLKVVRDYNETRGDMPLEPTNENLVKMLAQSGLDLEIVTKSTRSIVIEGPVDTSALLQLFGVLKNLKTLK